jgi:hypothetical protein
VPGDGECHPRLPEAVQNRTRAEHQVARIDERQEVAEEPAHQPVFAAVVAGGDKPTWVYFSLKHHLPQLEEAQTEWPDVRLIVIDPISAYRG